MWIWLEAKHMPIFIKVQKEIDLLLTI
jgi:hypothetical protein